MIKKPDANEAPLKLTSIRRYILTSCIFEILRELSVELGGEIQLTASIKIQVQ